jgi:hypothetical protein
MRDGWKILVEGYCFPRCWYSVHARYQLYVLVKRQDNEYSCDVD